MELVLAAEFVLVFEPASASSHVLANDCTSDTGCFSERLPQLHVQP